MKLADEVEGIRVRRGVDEVPVVVTVRVALPLIPPDWAMMVVVPGPTAVVRPLVLTVATCTLLEIHWTWLVRFCEPLFPVREPVASNCDVSPTKVSVPVPGVTVMDGVPGVEPVPPGRVTVMSEVATTPLETAVISAVPEPTAVASPDEVMVATPGLLDVQATEPVMFVVEGMALPI